MLNKSPLISIITVVKNGDKHLEECFQSLYNQSYKNYEHIVIDGESTDKTLEIIGTQTQVTTIIPQGWYMFSYLHTEEQDLELFFENYTSEILQVKDYLGNTYLPEYNFNGIGNLAPGYGYQIKTTTSISINW